MQIVQTRSGTVYFCRDLATGALREVAKRHMQLYAAHGQVLCDTRLIEQARADRGLSKIVALIDFDYIFQAPYFLVRHADKDAAGDDTSWCPPRWCGLRCPAPICSSSPTLAP